MKKIVVFILITMILLTTTTSFAGTSSTNPNEVKYEDYALKLKEIGVFKGTSSGFELDREPTRVEAAVMFVRLLGAEKEALEKKYEHPFTDVPEWASDYVGYLYHEKLTNGISETTFGSNNNIQAKSYMTFILRALGYNDLEGDFSWSESLEFAKNKGIISEEDFNELNTKTFLRDHVAKVSYKALKTPILNEDKTLIEKLVDNNSIDKKIAIEIGLMKQPIDETEEFIEKEFSKSLTEQKHLEIYEYDLKYIRKSQNKISRQKYIKIKTRESNNFEEKYYEMEIIDNKKIRIKGGPYLDKTQWRLTIEDSNCNRLVWESGNINNEGFFDSVVTLEDKLEDNKYEVYIWIGKDNWYTSKGSIPLVYEDGEIFFPIPVSPVYKNNFMHYMKNSAYDSDEYLRIPIMDETEKKEIEKLAKGIIKGAKSDYEKLRKIHDWVAKNIYYNWDGFRSGKYGRTDAYGTLKNKRSVCAGYANLTNALLRVVGIPSRIVNGYALGVGTKEEWDENYTLVSNHAWNEAFVDGRWVILDTTWDSGNKYIDGEYKEGPIYYGYFDPDLYVFSYTHKIIYYNR